MGHHHEHDHFHETRTMNKKALMLTLTLTSLIMIVEFIGGLWTNSLALLSDSGHMLSDASSLALSLIAIWFASKPASANKTFGYYRFEMMAALANGVTLFLIAGIIIYEAIGRFVDPPTVASGSMILIAFIGLLANAGSAIILLKKADVENNLNMKSAYIHVLGDLLGSVGAVLAGVIMYFFNWYLADPIISVIVALLILKSAWGVFNKSVHILMEGSPTTINVPEVEAHLLAIPTVLKVHDLHIWTITSGMDMFTCHLTVDNQADEQEVLQRVINLLVEKYKIEHTTIQIEKPGIHHPHLKV